MRTISSLEEERVDLRKKIEVASPSGSGADSRLGKSAGTTSAVEGSERVDWKAISSQLSEAGDDEVADMRANLLIQQRVEKMSTQEMVAALDEIAGLDLSEEARDNLETMILGPLIEMDPELALNHFADRIKTEPDGVGWQLAEALKNWAESNPAAASAWFDRQIAAGTFDSKSLDGRSDLRIQYEGALLENLLASDPNAASQRLAAMPEDERREVLQQMTFSDLSEESQKTYAALVRGLVPEAERAGSFAHIASDLVEDGGFSKVSGFLDGVNATPGERAAAAKEAANSYFEQLGQDGKITAKDVEEMRGWLNHQAPGQTDTITGKALAEAAQEQGKFTFAEASQLAMKYNQSSPNDEVLIAFLEGYSARSNLEQAKNLADMIKDPQRREEILKQLR